jgi:hypothetical protein
VGGADGGGVGAFGGVPCGAEGEWGHGCPQFRA